MQKVTITYSKIPQGFLGFYTLNGLQYYCFWPLDVYKGTYTCVKYFSPGRKDYCYHITNADAKWNQRYFEIHIGNYFKDTKGCILVGCEFEFLSSRFELRNSKNALTKLFTIGDSFLLEFVKLT
jgi:hypothetical protein